MSRKNRKTGRTRNNRENRTVADRKKSLEPAPPKANLTLAGARIMYEGIGGKEFGCTISGYCRTQIFEFPGIDLLSDGDEPHHMIYTTPPVHVCVVSDLVGYFSNSSNSKHYAISPSLRHVVGETEEKIKSQQAGRAPVYLTIEEFNELAPVEMVKGECSIADEVAVRDGEKVPILMGGREGEQFITAWATVDGAWPELPNNQHLVNMIMAGVRAGQQSSGPIHKYVDQNGLVTDCGRFVEMLRPATSARVRTAKPMDPIALSGRASEIRDAIAGMAQDINTPHLALLVNSLYSDDYEDDSYQRLQYLGLWESLANAARRCLGYRGNFGEEQTVLAGHKTPQELKDYRDDIAHWWTDSIDGNFLADLQRTTNELIRRKYFLDGHSRATLR